MNLKELILRLQSMDTKENAKVVVADNKLRFFNIINVSSEFEDEVVIDIERDKEDYKL